MSPQRHKELWRRTGLRFYEGWKQPGKITGAYGQGFSVAREQPNVGNRRVLTMFWRVDGIADGIAGGGGYARPWPARHDRRAGARRFRPPSRSSPPDPHFDGPAVETDAESEVRVGRLPLGVGSCGQRSGVTVTPFELSALNGCTLKPPSGGALVKRARNTPSAEIGKSTYSPCRGKRVERGQDASAAAAVRAIAACPSSLVGGFKTGGISLFSPSWPGAGFCESVPTGVSGVPARTVQRRAHHRHRGHTAAGDCRGC